MTREELLIEIKSLEEKRAKLEADYMLADGALQAFRFVLARLDAEPPRPPCELTEHGSDGTCVYAPETPKEPDSEC